MMHVITEMAGPYPYRCQTKRETSQFYEHEAQRDLPNQD